MQFLANVNKTRKPKFDAHLKIFDLNNVPLVSGVSQIKWHLPHSIHGEHRGRTQKCPIVNHRVEYHYSKVIPVRIAIDRNSTLAECPIEFEVLQEFGGSGAAGAGGRDERITLGTVRLNLSEYVEESEAILRDGTAGATTAKEVPAASSGRSEPSGHHRKRSSLSRSLSSGAGPSPRSSHDEERAPATDVQDGVVRRYLMQDSKINSTLKINILMVQVDGERNYVAPAPKSASMFGGIAAFVAGDAFEPVDAGAAAPGHAPFSLSGKSRDMFEVQDMYRRALAASWASQPGELPADQCIEDIFAGGDGFAAPPESSHGRSRSRHHTTVTGHDRDEAAATEDTSPGVGGSVRREEGRSVSDDDEEDGGMMGTLRPRSFACLRRHLRDQSVASDRSAATVLGGGDRGDVDRDPARGMASPREPFPTLHRREDSKFTVGDSFRRSRSSSLISLATTLGSERDRGRDGFKCAREVDEFEVREDLVAWTLPGAQT